MTTNTELANGLRWLANLVENNPGLTEHFAGHTFGWINIPVAHYDDPKAELTKLIRATKAAGATILKEQDDTHGGVLAKYGSIGLHLYAKREQVCERVVLGTREVTETVPDPEALAAVPTVSVTRVVEDVDWVCRPLLAAGTETASA